MKSISKRLTFVLTLVAVAACVSGAAVSSASATTLLGYTETGGKLLKGEEAVISGYIEFTTPQEVSTCTIYQGGGKIGANPSAKLKASWKVGAVSLGCSSGTTSYETKSVTVEPTEAEPELLKARNVMADGCEYEVKKLTNGMQIWEFEWGAFATATGKLVSGSPSGCAKTAGVASKWFVNGPGYVPGEPLTYDRVKVNP